MAKNTPAKKVEWKTAKIALPVRGFTGWKNPTTVRSNGKEYQVEVKSTVSLPYYEAAADYIAELQRETQNIIEPRLLFHDGNEEYSAEIALEGWREPDEREMQAIVLFSEENNF